MCLQCRPSPAVTSHGGGIYIEGIGQLSTHAALQLAHRIADEVTP
jgi:hypothetical protein